MNTLTILLLLVSITLGSCGASRQGGNQNPELEALVDRTLGAENIIEFNDTRTFALCQQKPGADHARRQYRYVVVRLEDNNIVNEGVFTMGYVKWLDTSSIEVFSGSLSPGEEGGTKKIIRVNSRNGKNPIH
ncbi:MAG: hypothetical protein WD824_02260 [Cyclobacteriaceae bacterium]